MTYTYPLPTPPVVDTAPLTTAINAINAELDTISAAVEAIPDAPDLSIYAKVADLPSASEATITPVYDPLPAPSTIVAPLALAGATLMANMVGSQLVDNGRVHSFARTTTPPVLAWAGTLTISPTVGACKVRFGVLTAGTWTVDAPGNIDVSINGGTAINAKNPGWGWSWTNLSENVYTDGVYTWFEVPIAQSGSPTTVRVQIPTGLGFLPTVYAADAITSLTPSTPTGLILRDPRSGAQMAYRPSQLLLKTEIPAAPDLSIYSLKSDELSLRVSLESLDSRLFDMDVFTQGLDQAIAQLRAPKPRILPRPLSGDWQSAAADNAAPGTRAGAADRLALMFYTSPWEQVVAEMGFNVTTLIAGSLARAVVYEALPVGNAAEGWPGQLVFLGSSLSCATTGFKSDTNPLIHASAPGAGTPFKFEAGKGYWMGVHHSGTATLRALTLSNMLNLGYTSSTGSQSSIIQRTVPYANALPTTFGMVGGDRVASNSVAEIRWRVA